MAFPGSGGVAISVKELGQAVLETKNCYDKYKSLKKCAIKTCIEKVTSISLLVDQFLKERTLSVGTINLVIRYTLESFIKGNFEYYKNRLIEIFMKNYLEGGTHDRKHKSKRYRN